MWGCERTVLFLVKDEMQYVVGWHLAPSLSGTIVLWGRKGLASEFLAIKRSVPHEECGVWGLRKLGGVQHGSISTWQVLRARLLLLTACLAWAGATASPGRH